MILISPLLFIRLAAFQGFLFFLLWGCNGPFYHQKQTKTSLTPQNTSFHEDGMPSLWLIYIGEKRTLGKGYGIK